MSRPRKYRPKQPTLGSFLKTLPVYSSLKSNVILTTKLTPIISAQIFGPSQKSASLVASISLSNNSDNSVDSAGPEGQAHTLFIDCKNSAVVTQLRHSQASLLEQINTLFRDDAELSDLLKLDKQLASKNIDSQNLIRSLKFRVSSHSGNVDKQHSSALLKTQRDAQTKHDSVDHRHSEESANMVQALSKHLSKNNAEGEESSELAESLLRLAGALKRRSSNTDTD